MIHLIVSVGTHDGASARQRCLAYVARSSHYSIGDMTKSKYKPGDRVISLRWPHDGAGVVVRSSPVHSLIRWDGLKEDKQARTVDIRPETEEDVAQQTHKQTIRTWQDRQPKLLHVSIARPTCWGSLPDGAQFHGVLRSPEEMRGAAAELLQLADWFAERPVKL